MKKTLLLLTMMFVLLFSSYSTTIKDQDTFLKFRIISIKEVEVVSGFKGYMNGKPIDKKKLVSIEIPDTVIIGGKTYKTVSIHEYAFKGCTSLTSIEIPNSVTEIGSGAFKYCESLTSIVIPNSITSIGKEAFWGCSKLKTARVPVSLKGKG